MEKRIETVIIGGGQAGLATSYHLTQQSREHMVLERTERPAPVWSNQRWDSFCLNTPNWTVRMPGAEYAGSDPDGFMPRADVVRYFDDYVERFKLPVRYQVEATRIERVDDGYRITTNGDAYHARNAVIATGLFQSPRTPLYSARAPISIQQLDTTTYRNPGALPAGAVLVVGSGQSGCQIAEDLYEHGRTVYLSVGSAPRAPRRYRGKDLFWWMDRAGPWDRPVDQLPSPRMKFAAAPQFTGTKGGHSLNLHQFARDGVILLGHLQDIRDGKLVLAPDLHESLAKADRAEVEQLKMIDGYITRTGIDAPVEEIPVLRDGYSSPLVTELDLNAADIGTIIWTLGFKFDYSLVKLPVIDDDGFPVTQRGVTNFPGVYFIGMPWLYTFKSGLLLGVGRDAAHVASQIATRP